MSETMSRCATCRFWTQEPPPLGADQDETTDAFYERMDIENGWFAHDDLRPRDPVTHEPMVPDFPIGLCKAEKITQLERPMRDGASVLDGSGYDAAFFTGPDFGCTLHEPNAASRGTPREEGR